MTVLALLVGSVAAGILLVELTGLKKSADQKWFLILTGSYLFGITIVHILPESTEAGMPYVGLVVLIGFVVQYLLDFISGGIEHGHAHLPAQPEKLPFGLLLGLYVHAIVEGVPTSLEHNHHHDILISAILLHKIPISMVLYLFLKRASKSPIRIWTAMIGFALCAPLGYLIGNAFASFENSTSYLLGFTAGIFLHVSTSIIFESGADHSFNLKKLAAVLVGFALALLTLVTH